MNKRKISKEECKAYAESLRKREELNDIRKSIEDELAEKLRKGEISFMEFTEEYFFLSNRVYQVWKEKRMR